MHFVRASFPRNTNGTFILGVIKALADECVITHKPNQNDCFALSCVADFIYSGYHLRHAVQNRGVCVGWSHLGAGHLHNCGWWWGVSVCEA